MKSWVDIIGAPGSGKSTLVVELQRGVGGLAERIIDGDRVWRRTRPLSWLWFKAAVELVDQRSKRLHVNEILGFGDFQGRRELEEWVRTALGAQSKCADPARAATFFVRSLNNYVCAQQYCGGETVLFTEPLSYRLSLFTPGADIRRVIREYVGLLPLPSLAVHLICDVEMLVDRLVRSRRAGRKVAHRHRGLTSVEVAEDCRWAHHVSSAVIVELERRGVPVCEVDSSLDDVRETSSKLGDAIKSYVDD